MLFNKKLSHAKPERAFLLFLKTVINVIRYAVSYLFGRINIVHKNNVIKIYVSALNGA